MTIIRVHDWWDLFTFADITQLDCPDCDQRSPEVENIWQAIEWVERHALIDCATIAEAHGG